MNRSLAAADGRHCVRCGADIHPPDPPHLCKDLRQRMDRQEEAIGRIEAVFEKYSLGYDDAHHTPEDLRDAAEEIYKTLSGRDLP